ncbi:hypothetical protein SAMN04490239_7584 [Rhodococcus koreensis]|uniref:DUF222 domain-containing protein n=1 Tax=Rhodococcus koreensis TaxID=99653 RepID=A0A1H4ZCA8_9NOCA|nr:hypothetical protein SAMN04490239_7584 [Rhodococcus koreensis]
MGDVVAPDLEELRAFTARLRVVSASGDPGLGIEWIDAVESLKSVGCAVQAVVTDDVATCMREDRKARRLPRAEWDRGIGSQIALARRESPNRGGRHLGFARAVVDRRLCSDPDILDGVGDRGLVAKAKALAVELDAAAVVARYRKTVSERRVTTRPAPDSMAYLSVLMPMEQAVCLHATLGRGADSLIATGDSGGRTRNQLMVDLLFDRGTGASVTNGVPVAVNLVISDEALLAGENEAADLAGFGPVPAGIARKLVADALDSDTAVTLRNVYSCPVSGSLTAMESQARTFPKSLAKLIDLRDRTCRTPWCDAPIRHHDHILSRRKKGATTAHNGGCARRAITRRRATAGPRAPSGGMAERISSTSALRRGTITGPRPRDCRPRRGGRRSKRSSSHTSVRHEVVEVSPSVILVPPTTM